MHVTLLLGVVLLVRVDTARRPNIVVVVTDDQDVTMGGTTPRQRRV